MRSSDTAPDADRAQLELFRKATVAQRAALGLSLSRMTMQLAWRAIEEANPESDREDLAVRFAAAVYGRALADDLRRDLEARRRQSEP